MTSRSCNSRMIMSLDSCATLNLKSLDFLRPPHKYDINDGLAADADKVHARPDTAHRKRYKGDDPCATYRPGHPCACAWPTRPGCTTFARQETINNAWCRGRIETTSDSCSCAASVRQYSWSCRNKLYTFRFEDPQTFHTNRRWKNECHTFSQLLAFIGLWIRPFQYRL